MSDLVARLDAASLAGVQEREAAAAARGHTYAQEILLGYSCSDLSLRIFRLPQAELEELAELELRVMARGFGVQNDACYAWERLPGPTRQAYAARGLGPRDPYLTTFLRSQGQAPTRLSLVSGLRPEQK